MKREIVMPNPDANLTRLDVRYAHAASDYLYDKWELRDHPIRAARAGITKKSVESMRRRFKRLRKQNQAVYDAMTPEEWPEIIF